MQPSFNHRRCQSLLPISRQGYLNVSPAEMRCYGVFLMKVEYLDQRMEDGSRLFAIIRDPMSWAELRQHLERMQDLKILRFITDGVTEGWLDFYYFGHQFSVNDPMGEFWFFVEDPGCASFILGELMTHLRKWQPSA